jgi:hypothetical protein
MRLTFCALCGRSDSSALENHHIIPKILGGTDDESNILTVCGLCHGVFHSYLRPINLSDLIKEAYTQRVNRNDTDFITLSQQKVEEVQRNTEMAEYYKKRAEAIIKNRNLINELLAQNALLTAELEPEPEPEPKPEPEPESEPESEPISAIGIVTDTTDTVEVLGLVIDNVLETQEENEMPRLRPIKDKDSTNKKDENIQISNAEHLINTPTKIDGRNKDGYWGPVLTSIELHCATLGTRRI